MAEPENVTLVLLRELRSRIEMRFDAIDRKLADHDTRFEALDAKLETVKKAAIEERLAALETQKRT
ncbi:hypothetical protein PQJ75_24780 [Rhodoplanes sp. TEM]|uniref:DUF904 domain-containing protein n=1 Tax=Rhodoplanes tepidamans TaxID=200616 RepID=A0ABT5J6Y2_RHOTP|nr:MULTISPECIES: hypothetical protein [Rhodoplanes]MDC7785413.1 hypothetical protein [Rhodoplanes tepidamans]MDC7986958.1 hypothetical protein [Rhodoplanes sp. TEM]MDQ0353134.1 DNA-binding HxlR family transcriptional regulator [Rhodoplanes tepidamans]